LMQEAEGLIDGASGDVRDVVLTLERGLSIEGTVVWPDGRLAEGGSVSASGRSGVGFGEVEAGRFRIYGLKEGDYRIEATARGKSFEGNAVVPVVNAGEKSLRLVLDETPIWSVSGTVVDQEGQPVDRFWAYADCLAGTDSSTTGSGHFVLNGLRAGECAVHVQANGYLPSEQRIVVGPRVEPLHFVLAPAGIVRGRVIDARGNPVLDAAVGQEGLPSMPGNGTPRSA